MTRDGSIRTIDPMKKETLIAIITGFSIGLCIAFFFLNIPTILKKEKNLKFPSFSFSLPNFKNITGKKTVVPTIAPTTLFSVTSPSDNSISADKKVKIQGTAPKDTLIIVTSEDEEQEVVVSADGTFSVDETLLEGANVYYVSEYKNDTLTQTKILTLFYTPEKL